MAEQNALPQFTDEDAPPVIKARAPAAIASEDAPARVPTERRRTWLATLDLPLLVVVGLLTSVGALMVYSTTFDWGYQSYGQDTFFLNQHLRNIGFGVTAMIIASLITYRIWRRLAVILLLATVGGLVAVLLFSDVTFGARRAFLNGSYQPGELAELVIVIYLAAWLSSKRARVGNVILGLIPFMILVGVIVSLILLQPDVSTAVTIVITALLMYFLAGANIVHLGVVGVIMSVGGLLFTQRLSYADNRLTSFTAGFTDLTQANYHTQQAIIAFLNGGWTGVGLGNGRQKFGYLPAPHTDSVFAVIGEELGFIGAMFVIALFIILVVRGFQIAARSKDSFGSLLASGITLWIITKALMNIAVMLSLLPSTGVALPLISYGGSSLLTIMTGAGILLSIARLTALENSPGGRSVREADDRGRRDGRTRVSSAGDRRGDRAAAPRR